MRITDVRTLTLACDGQTLMSSVYVLGKWRALIVEIYTDAGLVGIGEAETFGHPEVTRTAIESELRPQLIGADPLEIERLWTQMYARSLAQGRKGYFLCAMSGIDIALWDIMGKVCEQPVYRLRRGGIGGRKRSSAGLTP